MEEAHSTTTVPLTTASNLDVLASLIEHERCVLVLGPYASTDPAGRPLRQLLANEIADEHHRLAGRRPPDPDDLALASTAFLRLPDMPRTSLELLVRDFHRMHTEPSAIFREAARLPFRLVINTSADNLLQRAFLEERRRQFRQGAYRFSCTQLDDYDQTPEGETYLYQLFGRLDERGKCDATVLTLADQLNFIDSVQGVGRETRLPASLRNAMQDFEAFLFVGFDYENWYLKVLFHILKIASSEKTKLVFGLPEGLSKNLTAGSEAFFRQQFRFKFLDDDPLSLLRDIGQCIARGRASDVDRPAGEARVMLYIHSEADRALVGRLDRQLAQVKRRHGLVSRSIHEFGAGAAEAMMFGLVDRAAVIVPIVSSDLLADDLLFEKLTRRALSRQSGSVCVASVYAREAMGVADLLHGHPVLPAHTIPLTWMDEQTGLAKVAENLDSLISVLG